VSNKRHEARRAIEMALEERDQELREEFDEMATDWPYDDVDDGWPYDEIEIR